MSEMFTCADCGERTPADETFEIRHHGRKDRLAHVCGDCRSCSWCGETYDCANPCYTWAHIVAPEGNPDGSICVQCYAYTKGMLAVVQPDESIMFTVGAKGHCAHIDCRRKTTVVSVPAMRANEEKTLPFCAEHIGWAQKRYERGLNV